mmetsp:Transcript_10490/g.21694  ORF Transcript_10490/g.21694 Transcript_10490/m.21694 type:complete len:205 (+) Transcript_10490:195-809(+)
MVTSTASTSTRGSASARGLRHLLLARGNGGGWPRRRARGRQRGPGGGPAAPAPRAAIRGGGRAGAALHRRGVWGCRGERHARRPPPDLAGRGRGGGGGAPQGAAARGRAAQLHGAGRGAAGRGGAQRGVLCIAGLQGAAAHSGGRAMASASGCPHLHQGELRRLWLPAGAGIGGWPCDACLEPKWHVPLGGWWLADGRCWMADG